LVTFSASADQNWRTRKKQILANQKSVERHLVTENVYAELAHKRAALPNFFSREKKQEPKIRATGGKVTIFRHRPAEDDRVLPTVEEN
jgi:hypothetical protein